MTDQRRSEDQIRAQHIRDMGDELGAIYHKIWREVVWLHAKWIQYRRLWGHSPERVELLNKTAGHLFLVLQDALYDDVLVNLSRLTDRPGKGASKRLTLQRLAPLIVDPVLRLQVQERVQDAEDACASARASRHQRIAHTNLRRALDSTFDPLPSRADIEKALAAVRTVLHCLEMYYLQTETAYQDFLPDGGGADALVYHLEKGLRSQEREDRSLT